jgi:hypothetical protein
VDLGIVVRRLIGAIQALSDSHATPDQEWNGWQQLIDATLNAEAFELSGQIKQVHGVLPWLFLLALKAKGFKGVDIDIATETARDLTVDLKLEKEVLAFFGTDLDSIRETAQTSIKSGIGHVRHGRLLVLSVLLFFIYPERGTSAPAGWVCLFFYRRFPCRMKHK